MLTENDLRSQVTGDQGERPAGLAIQGLDGAWYEGTAIRRETRDGRPFLVIDQGQKFQDI